MTERAIGTWYYEPHSNGTFLLLQHDDPLPTFVGVIKEKYQADFICERLNEQQVHANAEIDIGGDVG